MSRRVRSWQRRPVDKTLAARRLSAALGEDIKPGMVERVTDEGLLKLTDDRVFCLAGGNAVYRGPVMGDSIDDYQPGYWVKNGKPWNIQPGEKIRPLPGKSKHVFE